MSRRRLTDEQIRQLKDWLSFKELCQRMGVTPNYGYQLRKGLYVPKTPSP